MNRFEGKRLASGDLECLDFEGGVVGRCGHSELRIYPAASHPPWFESAQLFDRGASANVGDGICFRRLCDRCQMLTQLPSSARGIGDSSLSKLAGAVKGVVPQRQSTIKPKSTISFPRTVVLTQVLERPGDRDEDGSQAQQEACQSSPPASLQNGSWRAMRACELLRTSRPQKD